MSTHYASCNLCEAICGLKLEVEGGRVVDLRGDELDVLSRGHLCPKASALPDLMSDPDRVTTPLRRRGTGWEEVSWDEAMRTAIDRLRGIQRAHGRDAVGFYYGNPTGHNYGALLYGLVLQLALRTKNVYSANSVDALPRMMASYLLYGNQAVIPVPDLDRTGFLLVLGANPVVSNGSVMTAPDCKGRLKALRARGGRLVVVDPRRSETAALADTHHFIRPGSDAYLLLAMLRVIGPEDDGLRGLVAPFTLELAERQTGIAKAEIDRLAREFAASPSAVAYGRMGACTQQFGGLTIWLIDVLNIVTGNLDRVGGAMFTTPAIDLGAIAARLGQTGTFDTFRSRVSGRPEFNGELPAGVMAEEIMTPGDGQIRGLITHAGNPVLSVPGGRQLDSALDGLDFMVSIDIYINETTRHADLILPTPVGLEHDHFALLFHALAVRNTVKYSHPVLPAPPGVREDWEVLLDLAAGVMGWPSRLLKPLLRLGPQRVLRLLLRRVSWKQLSTAEHGIDLGPLEPRLSSVLRTKDKQVNLVPEVMRPEVARALALAEGEPEAGGDLLLIGRRDLRSCNSWMHNSQRLVKGNPRCTLLMHPDDAAARGIEAGATVRLRTDGGEGEVAVEVAISPEVMQGIVSLPHGWGHDREGARLSVAEVRPGASVNDVVPAARMDALTGVSAFNGVPVRVFAPSLSA